MRFIQKLHSRMYLLSGKFRLSYRIPANAVGSEIGSVIRSIYRIFEGDPKSDYVDKDNVPDVPSSTLLFKVSP